MDIVIKIIIGIKITNNLSDNNGYYDQNNLCVITPNVLHITMDIVIKIMVCRLNIPMFCALLWIL